LLYIIIVYAHSTSLELLSEALQNFNRLRRVKHMSNRHFIVRVWLFLHAHDFIIHIKLHKLYSPEWISVSEIIAHDWPYRSSRCVTVIFKITEYNSRRILSY